MSVGTHNSYKAAIPEAELTALRARSQRAATVLDYSHRPLAAELDDGARQLELDIYYDPKGGRFTNPAGPRALGSDISHDLATELAMPGFKVMHIPDFDFRSTCARFVACLRTIKNWSAAHPDHFRILILILINAKDDNPLGSAGAQVEKFDTAASDALDETPQKVAIYRGKRRSLEGRLMFINTDESSPAAAYLTLNEPKADEPRIRAAVAAGFIVRTRADADTLEARANDTARRETAFASGAQYVSTDYMRPEPRFGSYSARLPNGAIAVCNPVRAAKRCGGRGLQDGR